MNLSQILFLILTIVALGLFSKKAKDIWRNINLGKKKTFEGPKSKRWKNVLLLAFGQKKMFQRPIPAILHLFVYVGFVVINIEMLEIVLDGILGTHRLFSSSLGSAYAVLINAFEILAFLVLAACVVFIIRRVILRIPRLVQGELKGWPKQDALIILVTEIVLMACFLIMNAADFQLQQLNAEGYPSVGSFIVSGSFTGLLEGMSMESLILLERSAWWIHIVGVFAFLNYLPYSKHLHIILGFPNAYYARLEPMGELDNMENIQKEVLYMMEPDKMPTDAAPEDEMAKFGAKDVMDLSWTNLMDAYACTECGRCTDVCPANMTGKALSPRKIMMDTRDRLEEVGRNINQNKAFEDDGKSLLNDYITEEELRACTTCNACVQACPVSIEPLDIIMQLRRYLIMEASSAPQEWNAMFSNIENNMAPWQFSPEDRDKWTEDLNTPS
ncbi:MAG TPA: 4Fe-4S dicluster domain-containing protein [Chitinophagaceae bacterium]|nr:4Fe-4S dicluster domain-containing protein [Chitinophagaceae bacterium]